MSVHKKTAENDLELPWYCPMFDQFKEDYKPCDGKMGKGECIKCTSGPDPTDFYVPSTTDDVIQEPAEINESPPKQTPPLNGDDDRISKEEYEAKKTRLRVILPLRDERDRNSEPEIVHPKPVVAGIDYEGHEDLKEFVLKTAEDQIRTENKQVLFFIKKAMGSGGSRCSTCSGKGYILLSQPPFRPGDVLQTEPCPKNCMEGIK